MGKGKRLRQQRTVTAPPQYPFIVDRRMARELGEAGLADLAANLWPKDCQTCGWELGADRPTVVVDDFLAFASAGLHHQRCQPTGWREPHSLSGAALTSYDVHGFVVPALVTTTKGDEEALWPVLMLNPSLEQVMLERTAGGWRVGTVTMWQRFGLRGAGNTARIDRPVPDMHADLDGDELTVTVIEAGQSWSVQCTTVMRETVRDLGGVLFAVTTALVPSELSTSAQLDDLARRGRVAMGWVALTGAAPPPLTETPAPEALTTFELHWGDQHASVGELLAATGQPLQLEQAQAWALSRIDLPELGAAEWRPVHGDPHTCELLDPLSATFYFLRRRNSGWSLIKIFSRIGGAPGTEAQLKEWARLAVKRRANCRIIDWRPAPDTAPECTTLHGSGAPYERDA